MVVFEKCDPNKAPSCKDEADINNENAGDGHPYAQVPTFTSSNFFSKHCLQKVFIRVIVRIVRVVSWPYRLFLRLMLYFRFDI